MSELEPRPTRKPNTSQIVVFNEACLQLKDPLDDKQWRKFAKAAEEMQRSGWSDTEIISGLWTVRPDIRPANMTPEEQVDKIREAEAQERQMQRATPRNPYPFGQLNGELEFHTSVIQHAALTGEQVVVRGVPEHPIVRDLPAHIRAASSLRPFYLPPGELFRAQLPPDKK